MDKTILADKAIKRERSTLADLDVKNAMTYAAKKKLEYTKKKDWTKL